MNRLGDKPTAVEPPKKSEAQLEWEHHEITLKLKQQLLERQKKLVIQIIRAAESSTDVNCVRTAVEYREVERQLRELG